MIGLKQDPWGQSTKSVPSVLLQGDGVVKRRGEEGRMVEGMRWGRETPFVSLTRNSYEQQPIKIIYKYKPQLPLPTNSQYISISTPVPLAVWSTFNADATLLLFSYLINHDWGSVQFQCSSNLDIHYRRQCVLFVFNLSSSLTHPIIVSTYYLG